MGQVKRPRKPSDLCLAPHLSALIFSLHILSDLILGSAAKSRLDKKVFGKKSWQP